MSDYCTSYKYIRSICGSCGITFMGREFKMGLAAVANGSSGGFYVKKNNFWALKSDFEWHLDCLTACF